MSGVLSGVVSGVPSSFTDAGTQETTTCKPVAAAPRLDDGCYQVAAAPRSGSDCEQVAAAPHPELVRALCDAGVTAWTATLLLRERGETECREQLAALPHRKAEDPAAVLVASIRNRWAMPGALVREREKQRREADRAAKSRARAIVEQHQQQARAALLDRLNALPRSLYASLEARAVSLWHQEQPAAARLMAGRPGGAAVVHGYMVRILETEGGAVHA